MSAIPSDAEFIEVLMDELSWLTVDGIISYVVDETKLKSKRNCISNQINRIQSNSTKRFTTRIVARNTIKVWRWK